jgi:cyclase
LEFALSQQEMGAGEILLNSIAHDGLRKGMDLSNIQLFSKSLAIPLVASSGAGSITDFAAALSEGASAVAAGAIFQFSELTPNEVREGLRGLGFDMRKI